MTTNPAQSVINVFETYGKYLKYMVEIDFLVSSTSYKFNYRQCCHVAECFSSFNGSTEAKTIKS